MRVYINDYDLIKKRAQIGTCKRKLGERSFSERH